MKRIVRLAQHEPLLRERENEFWAALEPGGDESRWGDSEVQAFIAGVVGSMKARPSIFGATREFYVANVLCQWIYRPIFLKGQEEPIGRVRCYPPGRDAEPFMTFYFDANGRFGNDPKTLEAGVMSRRPDAAQLLAIILEAFVVVVLTAPDKVTVQ